MNAALLKNYLTTILGVLAGLPLIIAQSGIVLNPTWNHYLMIASGIGIVGLGIVAKAINVHSTAAQVTTSTLQNPAVERQAIVAAQVAAIEAKPPVAPVPPSKV
jgi:hypothetical protein